MNNLVKTGLTFALAGALTSTFAEGPEVSFSGYADFDFATGFEKDFESPSHYTGVEIDLTTAVKFSDAVDAVIYTTVNDGGSVPALGAGDWWAPVAFDGAAINWAYSDALSLHFGDLIQGTGYFGYYLLKRSASVIPEHAVRGVGVATSGFYLHTGLSGDLTDPDGTGTATTPQWSTYAHYEAALMEGTTVKPSLKYDAGIPGSAPFAGGLSLDMESGDFGLSADVGFFTDFAMDGIDPSFSVLVEPSMGFGAASVAGALYFSSTGDAPSSNVNTFEDLFIYVEPGISINDNFAFGLPLEYHDPDMDSETGKDDESIWVVPTFYVYPADGVEVWAWGQVVLPMADGADPEYYAGIEGIFSF